MKELLEKYRTGKLTVDEFEDLISLMQKSSDSEIEDVLEQEWSEFTSVSSLSKNKRDELYPVVCRSKKVGTVSRYMSIAAGILLFICIGLCAYLADMKKDIKELAVNEVVFSAGTEGQSVVNLPDGSTVRLNARSSLKYYSDFGAESRKVYLEGEGFFDVKKSDDIEFIVVAPGMDIVVHGTKFNVYAYPERDFSEMSLVEGSVSLNSGEFSIKVAPNEKICVDRSTGRVNLMKTDNKVETAWLKKTLVFMHEPLYKVIDILERRFGVHIECSDGISLSDIYTGTFRDRSIKDILDVLKMHYGFVYDIDDNQITISNTNN